MLADKYLASDLLSLCEAELTRRVDGSNVALISDGIAAVQGAERLKAREGDR